MRHDLYTSLGVPRSASDVQIRSAYRHSALASHPDKGGSTSSFLAIVEAFEILSDAERRAAYDRDLKACNSIDGLQQTAGKEATPAAETIHIHLHVVHPSSARDQVMKHIQPRTRNHLKKCHMQAFLALTLRAFVVGELQRGLFS